MFVIAHIDEVRPDRAFLRDVVQLFFKDAAVEIFSGPDRTSVASLIRAAKHDAVDLAVVNIGAQGIYNRETVELIATLCRNRQESRVLALISQNQQDEKIIDKMAKKTFVQRLKKPLTDMMTIRAEMDTAIRRAEAEQMPRILVGQLAP